MEPTQPAPPPPAAPTPPLAADVPPHTVHHPSTSAGLIVLQWLTYAFWGWTVLAMSILTATVLANFISGADSGDFTPYGIAAVLVLLPISVVCDIFFSKHETPKKTGAASIVMVIHAVIFALFSIGSLITAVFSIISLFTSSGDTSTARTTLFSALIIFVLYAAVFLRTINPVRVPRIRRFYTIFMVISVGIITVLGIIGPFAYARHTKDDKLIEGSLYSIESEVNSYGRSHDKLPDTLNSLSLNGDSKKLVDRNLVEYKPNTVAPTTNARKYAYSGTTSTSKTFYYQLCVTYKASNKNRYGSSYDTSSSDSYGYSSYLSTYNHPAGRVCYKLKTDN